jgi:hypothetical protein
MSAPSGAKRPTKAATSASVATTVTEKKSPAVTCVHELTDPKGCPYGAKCRLDHTPLKIIGEHKLVLCRNGDACAAKKAPLKRAQPLYTNPRFGATCLACVRSERRAERQAEVAAEDKEEVPCRFFGRTIEGCRAGEKCKHIHNLLKCLDYYLLQWCPNQDKCVGMKHNGHRLLCPSTSQQCGECHQEMLRGREVEKRARFQERKAAGESKQAAASAAYVEQGGDDEYNKMQPCGTRGCKNETPGGRTCWECTKVAADYAPPRYVKQRLDRVR